MSQATTAGAQGPMKAITLDNDGGASISFRGMLYAQTSFFEENTGVLTKQELYSTEDGDQAFAIIASDGEAKQKSAYLVKRVGDVCVMSNGEQELSLPYEWLMMYTQALWDIDLDMQRQACQCDLESPDLSANA